MYRVTRTYESGEYKQKDCETFADACQLLQNWAMRAQFGEEKVTLTIQME